MRRLMRTEDFLPVTLVWQADIAKSNINKVAAFIALKLSLGYMQSGEQNDLCLGCTKIQFYFSARVAES